MVAWSWLNIHKNCDKTVGFLFMEQVMLLLLWRIVTSIPGNKAFISPQGQMVFRGC